MTTMTVEQVLRESLQTVVSSETPKKTEEHLLQQPLLTGIKENHFKLTVSHHSYIYSSDLLWCLLSARDSA